MPQRSNVDDLSPTLGWLEAFVATARHRNWQDAGQEIGIGGSSVRKQVKRLQIWLRRILVLDDCAPFELSADYDEHGRNGLEADFLTVATNILELFDQHRFGAECTARTSSVPVRKSLKSQILLADLERFLAVARAGHYKVMEGEPGGSEDSLRESVRKLRRALGKDLVRGRVSNSSKIELTEDGYRFADAAEQILATMNVNRMKVSKDAIEQVENDYVYTRVRLIVSRLRGEIRVLENRKPSKINRIRALEARALLSRLESMHEVWKTELGPFTPSSAGHIDVSKLGR